jgi:ankyrin repeat protein
MTTHLSSHKSLNKPLACPIEAGNIMKFLINKLEDSEKVSKWMNKLFNKIYKPFIKETDISQLKKLNKEELDAFITDFINKNLKLQKDISKHLGELNLTQSEEEEFIKIFEKFMINSYEIFTNKKLPYSVHFGGRNRKIKGGMIIELTLVYIFYKICMVLVFGLDGTINALAEFMIYLERCNTPKYKNEQFLQAIQEGNLSNARSYLYKDGINLTNGLEIAIRYNNLEIFKLILDKDKNVKLNYHILELLIDTKDTIFLKTILLKRGLYIDDIAYCLYKITDYIESYNDANTSDFADTIEMLLKYAKNEPSFPNLTILTNSRDMNKEFILQRLIRMNKPVKTYTLFKLCVEAGMNIDYYYESANKTLLMFAIDYLNLDVCKLLIKKGVKINIRVRNNMTSLLYAILFSNNSEESFEIIRLLLSHGAELTAEDIEKIRKSKIFKNPEFVATFRQILQDTKDKTINRYSMILSKNPELSELPQDMIQKITRLNRRVPSTIRSASN